MTSAVSFVAERMRMPSYSSMRRRGRRRPSSTSKCSRSSVDAGVADLLGDEDAHQSASRSTTQSMQAVSACTSAGSIAGNIPMRSWLRPSLR